MEIVYKMDFSLPGFLLCAAILGFGMNESFCFNYLILMKTHLGLWFNCVDKTGTTSQFIVGIVHFLPVLMMLSLVIHLGIQFYN